MLEAVLRFEGAQVRQVQVPRTDVVFLARHADRRGGAGAGAPHGYSRYPVYHGRDDNVIGILLAKDLLRPRPARARGRRSCSPPLFVPESKRVVELLREMRERRSHIALSVDEYGNLAGLVTLEDLLEMIVGDIQDEFDTAQPLWQRRGAGDVAGARLAAARAARPPHRQADRDAPRLHLGGRPAARARRPGARRSGAASRSDELVFEVVEASPRRIEQVRVTRRGTSGVTTGVGGAAPREHREDVVHDEVGHRRPRLPGGRAEVRQQHHVLRPSRPAWTSGSRS